MPAPQADQKLRTISETAEEIGVPHHVLRFWEQRFSAVKPVKSAGGRRYYRPETIALLHTIRRLLHEEGYTIKGVARMLRQEGSGMVMERASASQTAKLAQAIALLEEAKQKLTSGTGGENE